MAVEEYISERAYDKVTLQVDVAVPRMSHWAKQRLIKELRARMEKMMRQAFYGAVTGDPHAG